MFNNQFVSVEEQLSCCVLAKDVLSDPVSTSCGQWFSADSSSPQTGTSLLHHKTPSVPS